MTEVAARPPIDPQIAQALEEQRDDVVTALHADEIAGIRGRATPPDHDAVTRSGFFELSEHVVPATASTPPVPVVLLRPRGRAGGPLPLLLHVHGGGLVAGTAYDDLPWAAELAAATGCAVASPGYRLAPEDPYPAAVDDVHATFCWAVEHAASLGLDPDRVVLAGVSAGGGLAAATALLARDRGGPRALGQLLVCPMLDDRNDSVSARQMAGHGSWDRTANATGWEAYLPGRAGGDDVPAYASPLRADHLGDLPPALVDVGSAETFRDEDVEYARRIWRDGGEAELHVWPGGVHGFDFLAPGAELSVRARAARVRWLTRLLAAPPR
jgi:acetyl esterase/lipase